MHTRQRGSELRPAWGIRQRHSRRRPTIRTGREAALKAGGHPGYTLRIIPRANHLHLEAKTGSNPEMATLQRFVPEYFSTVRSWLASRVEGLDDSK